MVDLEDSIVDDEDLDTVQVALVSEPVLATVEERFKLETITIMCEGVERFAYLPVLY